jgi:hypothetical protein
MSRRDGVVLCSRVLAVLLTIWALSEVTYLPTSVYSLLHYAEGASTSSAPYWRHHYVMALGFLITRIVGYSLMASWLFRCGPDIEELLLPEELQESAGKSV